MRRIYIWGLLMALWTGPVLAQEINVWITYGGIAGAVLQDLIEYDFTPKTGIRVNYLPERAASAETKNKVILAYLGGDAPDVFTLDGPEVFDLAVRGMLEDFRQFPDFQQSMAHMYPNLFGQATYQNSVWGIPGETGWTQVYYRTDILDSLGLQTPQTWSELHSIMPRLQANGTMAYMGNFGLVRMFFPFIFQRGEDIFSTDGLNTNLNSPQAMEAFKEFTDLWTKHNMPLEMPLLPAFGRGEIAYMIELNWYYGIMNATNPQIQGKWALAEVPGIMRDGRLDRTVSGSSFHYLIPKGRDPKRLQAAWEFVKWISSPQIQYQFQQGIYESPEKWVLAFGSEENVRTARFADGDREVVERILRTMRMPTPTVGGFQTYRYIEFAHNRVVLQGVDPQEALARAAHESQAELVRKQQEFARFIRQ